MTRTIPAGEVTPGTLIEYSDGDITPRVPVHQVAILGNESVKVTTPKGRIVTLPITQAVTVLTEPIHVQPEEPTEFGVKVTVAGRRMIRCTDDPREPWPWMGEALNDDPVRWGWDELCEMGPITVVPEQGWTVPDTHEVPERIEEWDTWDDVPEGVVVTVPGLFCHYRKNQGAVEFSDPDDDPEWTEPGVRAMPRGYGPWTRVADV